MTRLLYIMSMVFVVLAFAVSGCTPESTAKNPQNDKPVKEETMENGTVTIRWFGQAYFLVTSAEGVKVAIDPFGEGLGYTVPDVEADFVLVTHGHFDHNNVSAVQGDPEVFKEKGDWSYEEKGIKFTGAASYHDSDKGVKRGEDTIYKLEMDGLSLVHLGDLGTLLGADELNKLGEVDILLMPAGGYYTLDVAKLDTLVDQLDPAVVIPMHYKTDKVELPIAAVDEYLKGKDTSMIRRLDTNELTISKNDLPDERTIIVLKYE